MKTLFYSAREYDRVSMEAVNGGRHEFKFISSALDETTVELARSYGAVCGFVNDDFSAPILDALADAGVGLILLRCTGFNNVDLAAAARRNLAVMRVLRYSPHSVAEFAIGLTLALNRKLVRAVVRNREGYFLLDGLLGFDLHGKTFGIAGTGKIGSALARIVTGFGCRLLGYDPYESAECKALGLTYVSLDEILAESDVLSLHMPLTPDNHHLIGARALSLMKPGALLINTSRGPLIDTPALIEALKGGRLGGAALDVYEEEEGMFFHDVSERGIPDDLLARLMTFPNVLVTGHQAFFTREALHDIATATLQNIADCEAGRRDTPNALTPETR